MYENKYCNCTARFGIQSWCKKWSSSMDDSFCILNGGVLSGFCPGSWQLTIGGEKYDEYLSSDPFTCNKAESKNRIRPRSRSNNFCTSILLDRYFFDDIISHYTVETEKR